MAPANPLTVGVLALQGGFHEHVHLLRKASARLVSAHPDSSPTVDVIEVRTAAQLAQCDALVIPGGESTTISLIATQTGLMEPLKEFVKVLRKPVWGTCAGMILLADEANATKKGGQELIGGLAVRVRRNHFGRQIESFVSDLDLPFLNDGGAANGTGAGAKYSGVFIRAPIVEEVLKPAKEGDSAENVEILAVLPGRTNKATTGGDAAEDHARDIIAVRQGNILGMSFHPELTQDERIHAWWLKQVIEATEKR
ncbi:hypothetical protein jhhlp_008088 [Lomentospora prolificans]|uniref:glutaminase n=1 Tax=Lomentospora prolificans TaxID=41688 RepID=A0A2N3MZI0_9PEZI|nr:hypothetical protein jhhlp_008088 [Lomentospora prolificans]